MTIVGTALMTECDRNRVGVSGSYDTAMVLKSSVSKEILSHKGIRKNTNFIEE